MARHFNDWLTAFVQNSNHLESPRFVRFWAGVSTIASVLRRRVWIDNKSFKWYPNFFIFIVAPPGVVSKSTAADLSTSLLHRIQDIHVGASSITWQALVSEFAKASVSFEYPRGGGEWHPMSAITLVSRELGSLIDPRNGELINLFIELWDGSKTYEKVTKMSGNDIIECPCINLIGATTPSWVADNVPASLLGGGFISRCIFLYSEEKEKLVPQPRLVVPSTYEDTELKLIQDLEHIAINLLGPYELTKEALEWEAEWYRELWKQVDIHDDRVQGYRARKQTHLNKLAIVLAASQNDDPIIDLSTIRLADKMLSDTELDASKVFDKIGRSQLSIHTDKLMDYLKRNNPSSYQSALRYVHSYFPDFHEFENVLAGLIQSDMVTMVTGAQGRMLVWNGTNGRTAATH